MMGARRDKRHAAGGCEAWLNDENHSLEREVA